MKLNHECVRDFLLTIEDDLALDESKALADFNFPSIYKTDDIIYTAMKLKEAQFISAEFSYGGDALYSIDVSALTWEGHKFLDTIRDKGVWEKTKMVTQSFSSVSLTTLSTISSKVISQIIANKLGL